MGLHDMQISPPISRSQSFQIVLLSDSPLRYLSYEICNENANTQYQTIFCFLLQMPLFQMAVQIRTCKRFDLVYW